MFNRVVTRNRKEVLKRSRSFKNENNKEQRIMKTEANVNNKGDVTFLAEQRIAGRLILVEGDTRVEAMGGLLHRLVELEFIDEHFKNLNEGDSREQFEN